MTGAFNVANFLTQLSAGGRSGPRILTCPVHLRATATIPIMMPTEMMPADLQSGTCDRKRAATHNAVHVQ